MFRINELRRRAQQHTSTNSLTLHENLVIQIPQSTLSRKGRVYVSPACVSAALLLFSTIQFELREERRGGAAKQTLQFCVKYYYTPHVRENISPRAKIYTNFPASRGLSGELNRAIIVFPGVEFLFAK